MEKYLIWCEGIQLGSDESVEEFESQEKAEEAAYEMAYQHLQMYAGLHGIPDDTEEDLEEAGVEEWGEIVDQYMGYGARLYDGHMKYDVSEEGLEPRD